jgi:hypothetical protein
MSSHLSLITSAEADRSLEQPMTGAGKGYDLSINMTVIMMSDIVSIDSPTHSISKVAFALSLPILFFCSFSYSFFYHRGSPFKDHRPLWDLHLAVWRWTKT